MKKNVQGLRNFIKVINGICYKSTSVPILSCIKYKYNKLIYNNLDIYIEYKLSKKIFDDVILDEGCLFNSEKLRLILKNIGSFKLETAIEKNYDMEEYPVLTCKENKFFEIKSTHNLIGMSLPFMTKDETRYYLMGIYFDKNKIIATDGHVLVKHTTDCKSKDSFIVPKETCEIISNFSNLEFSFDKKSKRVIFKNDRIKIISKTIDGVYPDYKKLNKFFKGKIEKSMNVDDFRFLKYSQRIDFDKSILRCNALEYDLDIKHKMSGKFWGKNLRKIIDFSIKRGLKDVSFKHIKKKKGKDNPPISLTIGNSELLIMPLKS